MSNTRKKALQKSIQKLMKLGFNKESMADKKYSPFLSKAAKDDFNKLGSVKTSGTHY